MGPDGLVIPEHIITRAPTAELRENQTDQDSLPPYDTLDAILERLVEREEPIAAIVDAGFDKETVARVARMLDLAEYKRRQSAPGVKVTLQQFRPRPPLSDRQPLPRSRRASAAARSRVAQGQERRRQGRGVRFLNGGAAYPRREAGRGSRERSEGGVRGSLKL